ncbi:unnamed protein product [Urochloa humidicola]
MDAEEERLRFALLAGEPTGILQLPAEEMRRAIAGIPGMGEDNFSITRFAPECFLVIFGTRRARDHALGTASVPVAGTRLYFRPWTRLVRATADQLRFRVSLEIEGIPAHAWSWHTARKILASSCWIEHLEPSSEDRSDMSKMTLTAWTNDPRRIPREKTVIIAEHEAPVVHSDPDVQRIFANVRPYLRQKGVLKYEAIIHLRGIADFTPRSPSPSPGASPPLSDGDPGQDGNPDRDYGFSRGDGGPRLRGFTCHSGVVDGAPLLADGGADGLHDRSQVSGVAATTEAAPTPPPPETIVCEPSADVMQMAASEPASPDADAAAASPAAAAEAGTAEQDVAMAAGARTANLVTHAATSPVLLSGQYSPAKGKAAKDTPVRPQLSADSPTGGHFPEREGDNVQAGTTGLDPLLASTVKLWPPRDSHVSSTPDPMLFEFEAPTPKLMRPQANNRATPTAIKTYKRRARSDAARSDDVAALQHLPPAEPIEEAEPRREPTDQSSRSCAGQAEPLAQDETAQAMLANPATSAESTRSRKTARPPHTPRLEEAKAATAAFLASVSHALQALLADMPPRRDATRAAGPTPAAPETRRRSERLANEPLNASVRPSKKGEVMVMRKLGLYPSGDQGEPRQELKGVFTGPLDTHSFSAIRDIFPAAHALSGAELMAAAMQVGGGISVC